MRHKYKKKFIIRYVASNSRFVNSWCFKSIFQTGIPDIGNWKYGISITNTCLAGFIFMAGYFNKYRFDSRGSDYGLARKIKNI